MQKKRRRIRERKIEEGINTRQNEMEKENEGGNGRRETKRKQEKRSRKLLKGK